MRAILLIAVLAIAAPDRPAPPMPEKPPSPQQVILGDWQDTGNRGFIFRIMPNESHFLTNGKISEADGLTAQITIDWNATPTAIDFMPRRGGKMQGIVKVEGDKLTLALNTGGGPRPRDFRQGAGGDLLLHYQRVKK